MIWFEVEDYLPAKECDLFGLIPDVGIRKLRFVPADEETDAFFVPGEHEPAAHPIKWMTQTMMIGHFMEDEGWEVHGTGGLFLPTYPDCDVAIHPEDTLYRVRHMALSWYVVNAAMKPRGPNVPAIKLKFEHWWYRPTTKDVSTPYEQPLMAIKAWYDKILALSLEVGLLHG